jgi:hypothetical protein
MSRVGCDDDGGSTVAPACCHPVDTAQREVSRWYAHSSPVAMTAGSDRRATRSRQSADADPEILIEERVTCGHSRVHSTGIDVNSMATGRG